MTQPRDFGFGSEEQLLRDQARKFLDRHAPLSKLRELTGRDHEAVYVRGEVPGHDREIFRQCIELGWTALAVPEAEGGLGASLAGVVALVEEVGRHAWPSPLVATLIATYVLRHCRTAAARELLSQVAVGKTIALAMTNGTGSWELDATEVRAEPESDGFVLDGTAYFVQDALKVDGYVVAVRTPWGIALVAVDRKATGLSVVRDHIVDLTRDQAHITFERVSVGPSDVLAAAPDGLRALQGAQPAMLTLVSADLVGCAEWQLQTTVEYAKTRRQFDHTIGFFQAVKHPLVNAMMEIDAARSHLYNAACAVDHEPEAALVAARMAKSAASDAAAFVSDRSVQLHGGIGFTWECDIQIFFKRSQHNRMLYGDGPIQRRRLADALIGPTPVAVER